MRFARACRRFSALCAGSNARGLAGRGSFVRRGSGSKSGRRRGTGSHSSSRRRRRHRSRSTAQIDRRNRQHRTELEPARIVSHERAGIRVEQCARHLFACRAVFRSGEFARDVPERLSRLDGVLRSASRRSRRCRRSSRSIARLRPRVAWIRPEDHARGTERGKRDARNAHRRGEKPDGDERSLRLQAHRSRKKGKAAAQNKKRRAKRDAFHDSARRRRVVYFTCRAECAACGAAVRPRPTATGRRP